MHQCVGGPSARPGGISDRTPCTCTPTVPACGPGLAPGRSSGGGGCVDFSAPCSSYLPDSRELLSHDPTCTEIEPHAPVRTASWLVAVLELRGGTLPDVRHAVTARSPFRATCGLSAKDGLGPYSDGGPDRRCEATGVRMDSASLSPSRASCGPRTEPAVGRVPASPRSGCGLSGGTGPQLPVRLADSY